VSLNEEHTKLAKILIDLVSSQQKQIIFTTHSEHMLYPFLAKISQKSELFTQDVVSIYYFEQNKDTGISTAENLEINEHGQLKGGLKGFWEEDMKIFSEFRME
jgi:predicted ATPase